MNFEECYKKLEEGTATQEEAAFVATEIVRARKILRTIGDTTDVSCDAKPKRPAHIHHLHKDSLHRKVIPAIEEHMEIRKAELHALLDSELPTSADLVPAETEAFRKARKKHIWNVTIRIILVTLIILGIVAGCILWYIFGTASKSANQHEVYTREQAVEIAMDCVENYVGHDIERLMIHDIDRHVNLAEGIRNATRVLEIELNDGVTEYEVRVNLATGAAVITDIDN